MDTLLDYAYEISIKNLNFGNIDNEVLDLYTIGYYANNNLNAYVTDCEIAHINNMSLADVYAYLYELAVDDGMAELEAEELEDIIQCEYDNYYFDN